MKITMAFALGALVFVSGAVAARSAPTILIVRMTWVMSVDADGHVTRLSTADKQIPAIHDRLEQAIRGWRFGPGKVNGKPAPTDSRLQIALELTPSADGAAYAVRVISAATGGGYGKMTPPRYPQMSILAHKQGLVVLKVRYDDAGTVVDAALAEGAPRVDAPFVEAAVAAVHKWTFEPEVVGGHPMAGAAFVPVCFQLRAPRMAPPDCNWHKPGSDVAVTGDQAVALDPAVTLLTDVIGRAL